MRAGPVPPRERADRCPGVLRPWPADDGGLVRVRLIGGRLTARSLRVLGEVSRTYGDADLHLTGRANLQLRGLPLDDAGRLLPEVVAAVEGSGLLPSRRHDLARNVMVSPLTGLAGGRFDLRPVAAGLDRLLCSVDRLGDLPGRFLFVLDDGRGDLVDLAGLVRNGPDLGLVALDDRTAQLRHGAEGWGEVVALDEAPARLVDLALAFLDARGEGAEAAWHVSELARALAAPHPRDPRTRVRSPALPHGPVAGGVHVAAPDGVLDTAARADLLGPLADDHELVVTPWRGVLVPDTPVEDR